MGSKQAIVKWAASIALLLTGIVYVSTMGRSLVSIDAGELAVVQIFAGIAHPTGYPLFTIIGHLWSLLPLGIAPIIQLNFSGSTVLPAFTPIHIQCLRYNAQRQG